MPTVKKDKTYTKRIINKENRISPKLEKHYPYLYLIGLK